VNADEEPDFSGGAEPYCCGAWPDLQRAGDEGRALYRGAAINTALTVDHDIKVENRPRLDSARC
jgi:hypothetical protein